jgi:hypothetical protein
MVRVEIVAQDIDNILSDLEQQFEIVEHLEFWKGDLLFSIGPVSGKLEIHPSENAIVFSIPIDTLVIENTLAQAYWAFNPLGVLAFLRKSISQSLGISDSEFKVLKTREAIELHLPHKFVWEKLDLEFLPRKLRLTKIQSNEEGIKLEFDLSQKR